MTDQEARAYIERASGLTLTPEQVAKVLGCDAQAIRDQAKEDIRLLGFPASRVGTRTLIPKQAFMRHMGWE